MIIDIKSIENIKSRIGNNIAYVLGNFNLDLDTYCSTIIISDILKAQGIDAIPITTNMNGIRICKNLCETFNLNYTPIKYHKVTKEDYIFKIENGRMKETENIVENKIIGCINDYANEMTTHIFNRKKNLACATIYDLAKSLNYELNNKQLKYILYTLAVMTNQFNDRSKTSPRTLTLRDELMSKLNISSYKLFLETLELTDLTKSDEDIINLNKKEFRYENYTFTTTYISVHDDSTTEKELRQRILNKYKHSDLFVYVLVNQSRLTTEVYSVGVFANLVGSKKYYNIVNVDDVIIDMLEKDIA